MANKSDITRKRNAQLSVRIEESLFTDYKTLLEKEGVSMTSDIENYIASRLGRKAGNVIDIHEAFRKQQQDIEELKAAVGELKAGWPQKTSNSKAS